MWEDLIKKAKDGGLDVIDTYVFWNGHEPSPGTVRFFFWLYPKLDLISSLISPQILLFIDLGKT